MPEPYLTAAELITHAHQQNVDPIIYTLDIADSWGWEPDHTIEALHVVRRTIENMPQPMPQPHHAIQIADQFHRELDDELDLPATVASYLTTLDAYQQSGDPSEAEALEALEHHMARLVGLDPDTIE
jgi:hypothetical protein